MIARRRRLTDREIWARSILEDPFQSQIIAEMRRTGWTVGHFRAARMKDRPGGQAMWRTPVQADGKGFFDLFAIRPPRLILVEVKRQNGKLDDDQIKWRDLALACPCVEYYEWRPLNWDQIVEVLA